MNKTQTKKIVSSKIIGKIEKTMLLKSLFVISWYLNQPRDIQIINAWNNAGEMNLANQHYILFPRNTNYQESYLLLVCNLG